MLKHTYILKLFTTFHIRVKKTNVFLSKDQSIELLCFDLLLDTWHVVVTKGKDKNWLQSFENLNLAQSKHNYLDIVQYGAFSCS